MMRMIETRKETRGCAPPLLAIVTRFDRNPRIRICCPHPAVQRSADTRFRVSQHLSTAFSMSRALRSVVL
eukprot:3767867-Rhodomonas_salina.1